MCLKNPNWFNSDDRERYQKLIEKSTKNKLTEKEHDFLFEMYHQEEFFAYGEC